MCFLVTLSFIEVFLAVTSVSEVSNQPSIEAHPDVHPLRKGFCSWCYFSLLCILLNIFIGHYV